MRVFKNNEELKELIVDGNIVVNDDIECNFNIDVKANIKAKDINAWDIKAKDINAWDINANDIKARDIKAWYINARDISYYAFCISYNNIICTSIKGRRENSFHKCLDGELTIKEELKEITINNQKFMLSLSEINELKNQLK